MISSLIVRWLTTALALYLTSLLFDGIQIDGIVSLLFASLALAVLNALVRPVLLLVTLPLTIVTLGFFVFVVNAIVLKLAAAFVIGFQVSGFFNALFGAIVLSGLNLLLNSFLRDRNQVEYVYIEQRRE